MRVYHSGLDFVLCACLFACLIGCAGSSMTDGPDKITQPLCTAEMGAYHFDMDELTPAQKVEKLYGLGLSGMQFRIYEDKLAEIDAYFAAPLVKDQVFSLYSMHHLPTSISH